MSCIEMKYKLNYPGFNLDLELDIPSRGVTAFFGPSGCGKTTVLRLIAGLYVAKDGYLKFENEIWQADAKFLPPHKRRIGYVFQNANLFPHLTIKQNLLYGSRRSMEPCIQKYMDEVIELLGIENILERKPARLSGGEQQRVSIARALAIKPRILLMDEPLAALDQARKNEILPFLQRLHSDLRVPIIYVSHSPNEVAQLANHLVVLRNGQCLAAGDIQDVLGTGDLARILGEDACSVFDATITMHDANYHLLQIKVGKQYLYVREHAYSTGDIVRVRILARDVSLSLTQQEDSSILNHLQATVADIIEDTHPSQCLVRLSLDGAPLLCRMTYKSLNALSVKIGQSVWAHVKTMALLGPS